MPMSADQTQAQTATPNDLGAIFVSLELSKSTWLVTALSPGSEKMSRHSVTGGDIAGLFACFAALRQKCQRRQNRLYPLVVIQEVGLDGFWLGRVLDKKPGSRAILSRLRPLPCPAAIAGQKRIASMAKP
jgi:transposase